MRLGTERSKNVLNQKNGRYVQGGYTTLKNPKMLGWWERKIMKPDETDIITYVFSGEEFAPDAIAYRLYGRETLAWVILQFNNIVDINEELAIGTIIRAPSERRLMLDILNSSTGKPK